jgi:hypothetical protein
MTQKFLATPLQASKLILFHMNLPSVDGTTISFYYMFMKALMK